jgi:cob(I)alamin adenosyltransferase
MKIYTKSGDTGTTSLASGKRVSKADPSVEIYGTSDELNSSIGVSICYLKEKSLLLEPLVIAQRLLFELGSELAGFKNKTDTSIINEYDVTFLETMIDTFEGHLKPMKSFILPGGSKAAAFLHVSRTICRRLERLMVAHKENGYKVYDVSLKYVNRLSDFLFVAGRYANYEENIEDTAWTPRAKSR